MLCHTSLFIFPYVPNVTFYKTLASLSTVFIKGHVGFLQLLKWPCHTSFFTHVEAYLHPTDFGRQAADTILPQVSRNESRPDHFTYSEQAIRLSNSLMPSAKPRSANLPTYQLLRLWCDAVGDRWLFSMSIIFQ